MKNFLFFILLLFSLNSCYTTGSYVVDTSDTTKAYIFEVRHYESGKIFEAASLYSASDAKYRAYQKCISEFSSSKSGCLDYTYTKQGYKGPIESVNYWEKQKKNYLASKPKNDPKPTEWEENITEQNKITSTKETDQVINNDNLEEEKRKIEEEKKKIAETKRKQEEEKKRIADAKKKKEEERKKKEEENKLYIIGSGTGFFVSAEGHIVSNDHVVGICRKVASEINGELKYFNVLKTDKVNDLGLIKGDYKNPSYLNIKSDGAEFGEDIIAFGYPLADALSTSVKLTRGIVSSLSGPGNNYSEIQIDAAIQPGNSGGPVMNMDGQVVGVASSGLNKLYMLEKSEYIPENVNFAVASPTLANFLKANGVSITNQKIKVENTKELAKIGRPSTLQLFCMNTKAVFDELKEKKKHSDVLFEKVMDIK